MNKRRFGVVSLQTASGAPRRRGDVAASSRDGDFEAVVLPHLDAAHNLARWLMRDSAAAEDVLQEAMLRALTYFAELPGRQSARLAAADRAQHRLQPR